jgi:hypothetical protein
MHRVTEILFSLHLGSSGFEAEGGNEIVECGSDALVESVELRETLVL